MACCCIQVSEAMGGNFGQKGADQLQGKVRIESAHSVSNHKGRRKLRRGCESDQLLFWRREAKLTVAGNFE